MNETEILFEAYVRRGDAAGLRGLLEEHPELRRVLDEPRFSFDAPAIVLVASRGDRETLDVLLDAGADIDATSGWEAGAFGVLHHVAEAHPELAAYLVSRGATVDVHAAAALGRIDRLREEVARDPKEVVSRRGPDGQTPLHLAADAEIADLLLDAGADIDARCVDHGSTPAQWAIQHRPQVSRHLLDRGARPDIFLAAALGDKALIQSLAELDPSCLYARLGKPGYAPVEPGNILDWKLGWWSEAGGQASPHKIARLSGHPGAAELLEELSPPAVRLLVACERGDGGAALDIVDAHPGIVEGLAEEDRCLLADCAWNNDVDAVAALLSVGFDPHVRGAHGSTPLDRASFHGFSEVVRLLLEHDPEPPIDWVNEFGGTPLAALVYGARHGWRDDGDPVTTAELLLASGAELSPWMIAMATPELAEIFARHGHPQHPWSRVHRPDEAPAGMRRPTPLALRFLDDEATHHGDQEAEDADDGGELRRRLREVEVENRQSGSVRVTWLGTFVLSDGLWVPADEGNAPLDDDAVAACFSGAAGPRVAGGGTARLTVPVPVADPRASLPVKLALVGEDGAGHTLYAERLVTVD